MAETVPFLSVERDSTLVQKVVDQLEARIQDGQLAAGSRLPAERELGQQLGVSRTVVREAVAALTARELLEAAPGGGAVVRRPSATGVARSLVYLLRGENTRLDYDPVHEARQTLEVQIARLAAERRTDRDLAEMAGLLDEMETALGPTPAYCDDDVRFHRLLAVATHNPLFPVLLDTLADILRDVRRLGMTVPGAFENGRRHHRAILERVIAADPGGAADAMAAHLSDAASIQRRLADGEGAGN